MDPIDQLCEKAKEYKAKERGWSKWNNRYWEPLARRTLNDDPVNEIVHRDGDVHLYFDGLSLMLWRDGVWPTGPELAADMFDEWDDPVAPEDAQTFLDRFKKAVREHPFN